MGWIFFDVGSTLIDETEAYNQRAREMIAGTEITFQAFDQMRRQLAQKGLDEDSAANKRKNASVPGLGTDAFVS